jgi:divalent metal cation (Fe/Co/Zn/Cd) transporter
MSQTDPGVSCLKIGVAHIEVHPALESVRTHAVRRGRRLTWATIAYNCLEGLLSIGSGLLAGSVSLVGFGVDSFIEVSASLTAVWRLHIDRDAGRRARAERTAQRLIGFSFLALAGYVAIEATRSLVTRVEPDVSPIGIGIAAASLVVMPLLARAKRRVAVALSSGALGAEARQTEICMYLSAILLSGLGLNAALSWWWADPVAGLAMTPLIAWEGIEGLRGRHTCGECAPVDLAQPEHRGDDVLRAPTT